MEDFNLIVSYNKRVLSLFLIAHFLDIMILFCQSICRFLYLFQFFMGCGTQISNSLCLSYLSQDCRMDFLRKKMSLDILITNIQFKFKIFRDFERAEMKS